MRVYVRACVIRGVSILVVLIKIKELIFDGCSQVIVIFCELMLRVIKFHQIIGFFRAIVI